uniref:Short coiled-coil protein a n=2 Tax=Scleropages formosus TaxID=113540 RepID=A0A8C9T0B5_SCLFO|nr:uncharacterized protein LOC108925752 [Scleropages formosus]
MRTWSGGGEAGPEPGSGPGPLHSVAHRDSARPRSRASQRDVTAAHGPAASRCSPSPSGGRTRSGCAVTPGGSRRRGTSAVCASPGSLAVRRAAHRSFRFFRPGSATATLHSKRENECFAMNCDMDGDVEDQLEMEEKTRLINQVLELQHTLEDLSARVDAVKEENLKLKSENQVLGQYIENLMSASSVFQTTDTKSKRK